MLLHLKTDGTSRLGSQVASAGAVEVLEQLDWYSGKGSAFDSMVFKTRGPLFTLTPASAAQ